MSKSTKFDMIGDEIMVECADLLANQIREYAPTKRIKNNVRVGTLAGTSAGSRIITIEVDAPEAGAYEFGSGIHRTKGTPSTYPIEAKNFPTLQFEGTNDFKGQIIRKRLVNHPGVEARPYIKPAMDELRPEIRDILMEDGVKNLRLYLRSIINDFNQAVGQ
jgi:hypothetical protein